MDEGFAQSVAADRGTYLVHELVSTLSLIGYGAAGWLGLCVGSVRHDTRLGFAVFATLAVLVAGFAWRRARESSADAFFLEFAPTIGLRYVDEWALGTGTPLLAAGDRRCSD